MRLHLKAGAPAKRDGYHSFRGQAMPRVLAECEVEIRPLVFIVGRRGKTLIALTGDSEIGYAGHNLDSRCSGATPTRTVIDRLPLRSTLFPSAAFTPLKRSLSICNSVFCAPVFAVRPST